MLPLIDIATSLASNHASHVIKRSLHAATWRSLRHALGKSFDKSLFVPRQHITQGRTPVRLPSLRIVETRTRRFLGSGAHRWNNPAPKWLKAQPQEPKVSQRIGACVGLVSSFCSVVCEGTGLIGWVIDG